MVGRLGGDRPFNAADVGFGGLARPANHHYRRYAREVRCAGKLQHGVGVGLVQFEHAQSAIGALTHDKVLAGGGDIAEASLQRIRIE